MAGGKDTEVIARIPEQQNVAHPGYAIAFERALGRDIWCVGVHIRCVEESAPAAVSDLDFPVPDHGLTAAERARANAMRGYRRPGFVAGRLALRRALALLHIDARDHTIGTTNRGAPIVPARAVGSISHKHTLAVAVAARADGWTLGVDLEARKPTTRDISRRVLTAPELAEIDALDLGTDERALAVVLRFSIKEAIYKAIDPFVTRYVGFREVAVSPRGDGAASVAAHFDPPPPYALDIRASWSAHGDYFLSRARARPAPAGALPGAIEDPPSSDTGAP